MISYVNLESDLKCSLISYPFVLEGSICIVVNILFDLFKMDQLIKLVP